MTQTNREKVLKKAYEIWEAEGRPHGRDMEHWLKAELMLGEDGPAEKPAAEKSATKKSANS